MTLYKISLHNTKGIYAIVCMPTGKRYFGSTECIGRRIAWHRWSLRHNCNPNVDLQTDWNKEGEAAFQFYVVLLAESYALEYYEQCLIDSENCYNMRPAGCGSGFTISETIKERMRQSAIKVALRPGESENRSERAKMQHLAGSLGAHTLTEEGRQRLRENGKLTAHFITQEAREKSGRTRKGIARSF